MEHLPNSATVCLTKAAKSSNFEASPRPLFHLFLLCQLHSHPSVTVFLSVIIIFQSPTVTFYLDVTLQTTYMWPVDFPGDLLWRSVLHNPGLSEGGIISSSSCRSTGIHRGHAKSFI